MYQPSHYPLTFPASYHPQHHTTPQPFQPHTTLNITLSVKHTTVSWADVRIHVGGGGGGGGEGGRGGLKGVEDAG